MNQEPRSARLSLLGVQQFSTQQLCLLSGKAECPFHGNLAGGGMAGPGKLARTALLVLRDYQTGFFLQTRNAESSCPGQVIVASHPKVKGNKSWAEITF